MEYLFYLMVGSIAGLISGLFGLGGGAVIVPLLIFTFLARGISPEITTHLAIGTSLATIVFTALSSIYTHHQKQAIRWGIVKTLAPGILLGGLLGGLFAISLSGVLLQLLFGVFLIMVALQLLMLIFQYPVTMSGNTPLMMPVLHLVTTHTLSLKPQTLLITA